MNGRLLSADGSSSSSTAPLTLPPEALTAPDRATAAEPWVRGVPPRPSAAPDDEDEDDEAVRAVAFQASGMDEYLCGLTPDALTPPPLSVSIPPVSVPAPATAAVAPVAPAAPVWHACPSAHTPRTPRGSVGAPGASIGEARRVHAGSTPKDAPEEPRAAPPLSLSGRFSSRITRLIDRRHRATGSASAALAVPRRGVCVVPPAPGVYPPAAVSPSLSPSLSPSPSPPASPSPSRPPFPATATAAREDEDDRAPEGDVFPGAGAALPRGVVLRILGFLGPCDLARAAGVSRAWHRVCNTPRLWERLARDLGVCRSAPASAPAPAPVPAVPSFKRAVAEFRARGAQGSRRRLWDALYRPLLLQTLAECGEGGGMAGWLSVRGENLFMKWKRRWAAVAHNCLLLFRARRPHERPRLLVPLRGDLRVEPLKHGTFRLSSVNGVLLTLTLALKDPQQHNQQQHHESTGGSGAGAGTLVEDGRGFLYLSGDKSAAGRAWVQALGRCVALSRQLFGVPPRGVLRARLFGVPLGDVMAQQRAVLAARAPGVPLFVEEIVAHLRATALDEEGLFRVCGSTESVVRLRHRLEAGDDVDYGQEDPHTLTAVVKMFLRELPEPLVPHEVNSFLNTALSRGAELNLAASAGASPGAASASASTAEPTALVRMCLADLPRDSTALLRCLALFLRDIAAHADRNRMDQNNLFIVLVPTLRIAPALLALAMDHPAEVFGTR